MISVYTEELYIKYRDIKLKAKDGELIRVEVYSKGNSNNYVFDRDDECESIFLSMVSIVLELDMEPFELKKSVDGILY